MTIPSYLKSKTVLFAILLAVLSIAQGYVGLLPMSPVAQAITGCGIAAIVAVLRIVTTQPLSSK